MEKKNQQSNVVVNESQYKAPVVERQQNQWILEENHAQMKEIQQTVPENDRIDNREYRDERDLSNRRKEDLGEHHPYLSKQNFYDSGNNAANRVAFDPSLFPHVPNYHHNMPSNMGGYGHPNMGYMPYPGNYPIPGMEAYHMAHMQNIPNMNIYQEMSQYQRLMQQVIEERLKIERITLEEQLVFDQYQNKIKEMNLERLQYEKECERIKRMLQGELPISNSVLMDGGKNEKLNALNSSYLPTIKNLKNAKASHVSNYNRLLAQSQRSFMELYNAQPSLQTYPSKEQFANPNYGVGLEDTIQSQSAVEESAMFRQSLPAESDFKYHLTKDQLESSYMKDLEAYNAINHLTKPTSEALPQKQFSNKFLQVPQNNSNVFNFSTSLPMMSELKPIYPEVEGKEINRIMVNSELVAEVEETRAKMRKMETTPQVLYDKTPIQIDRGISYEIKDTSDFDNKLFHGVHMESNVSGMKNTTPKNLQNSSLDQATEKKEISEQDPFKAFEDQNDPYYLIRNMEQNLTGYKEIKVDIEGSEIKLPEGKSQRSLMFAEGEYNQNVYDDFMESNDNMLEDLILNQQNAKSSPKKVGTIDTKAMHEKIAEEDSKKISTFKDNWNNPLATQPPKTITTPRNISTPMSTGSAQGDRKYRAPKTIDPFAKAKPEVRTSQTQEKSMFILKDNENKTNDQNKGTAQKSYSEVSKLSGFIMESGKKGYVEENKLLSENFLKEKLESIPVKEDYKIKYTNYDDDEENEPYIDEDIPEKENSDEGEEEDNEYKFEFEEDEELRDTMNNKKVSPQKGKTVLEEKKSKKEVEMSKGVKVETFGKKEHTEKRSKEIVDRLQRLFDDLEDNEDDNDENDYEIKEMSEEYEENPNNKQDFYKPLGLTKGYSNRYSREGNN